MCDAVRFAFPRKEPSSRFPTAAPLLLGFGAGEASSHFLGFCEGEGEGVVFSSVFVGSPTGGEEGGTVSDIDRWSLTTPKAPLKALVSEERRCKQKRRELHY